MLRTSLKPQQGIIPFLTCKSEYITFEKKTNIDEEKPKILILCTFSVFSGLEMHCLQQHKAFIKNGYDTYILVPKNSGIEKRLIEEQIPFHCYSNYGLFEPKAKIFKAHRQPGLSKVVNEIIKKHNINIVNCNRAKDLYLLKKVPKGCIKIIFTRHAPTLVRKKYTMQFDGIIGVNTDFVAKTKQKQLKNKKIPIIEIPPFFEKPQIKTSNTSNHNFFRNEFGISIKKNSTTLVTIGVLNKRKNQILILKALHKLIYEKHKPFDLLLCGDGPSKNKLKKLSKKLKIKGFVHFLGFTDKRLDVIYHSDIKILASKSDANPIVLKEAAMLKKPLIGPTKTGVINTIKHKRTGLLFENGNVDDLVEKIETLIDNPLLQKEYGENGFEYVRSNFMPDILVEKLIQFYSKT